MAKTEVKPKVAEEPEEETYSQYHFENCTINITAGANCQVNVGVGKPQPFPPPHT